MTFSARSSLLLVEAMNLVRNSLLPPDGIESVISNTKQMSCTILTQGMSRGWGRENAMRHCQVGQEAPVCGLRRYVLRTSPIRDAVRDVNFMTDFSQKTGTKLTPVRA
jgi:hypothetical protein